MMHGDAESLRVGLEGRDSQALAHHCLCDTLLVNTAAGDSQLFPIMDLKNDADKDMPSAPDFSDLPPGYPTIDESSVHVPPPAYEDLFPGASRSITQLTPDKMTNEDIRFGVAEYVSVRPFLSSSVIQQMAYTSISHVVCHVYNLQSFTEKRETKWVFVPYFGGPIDGRQNGPIPGPWQVLVLPKQEFHTGKTKVPVPHSEYVKVCHSCSGVGRTRCSSCWGSGSTSCCSNKDCSSCHGSNRKTCTWCSGSGYTTCSTCSGSGRLKYFLQLKVVWLILSNHLISNSCGLKESKIIETKKRLLFEETDTRIHAVTRDEFPDEDMVTASSDLLQQHLQQSSGQRILKQKQMISGLPVTVVHFNRKGKEGTFFIYSEDRVVHFDSFPSHCCIV